MISTTRTLRSIIPALVAAIFLLAATAAHADFEQVARFAQSGEAEQFGGSNGVTGAAVNRTGAGGVEPGSVYFSLGNSGNRVVRYSPTGEFKEAWGWGVAKNGGNPGLGGTVSEQYERCGPALGTECTLHEHNGLASEAETTACGTATDPAGDLYVIDRNGAGRVYGPTGALLTEFRQSVSQTPIGEPCNLAVDSSGDIFVVDNEPKFPAATIQKLEPVGGQYPPTAATTYTFGSTIASFGVVASGAGLGIRSIAIDPANQHLYATEEAGDEMQEIPIPAEPFKLRCEGRETGTLENILAATPSSGEEIKEALEASPVNCGPVSVGPPVAGGEFWRVTFEGSRANKPVDKLVVVKASGNEEAIEIAVGSSMPHVSIYDTDGTRVETITPAISGASYYGIGVYGANGDIYVTDVNHNKAYILNPTGELQSEITGAGCEKGAFADMERSTVAVDQSSGNVLISDVAVHGVVDEFNSSGSCLLTVNRPFTDASPSAIAVDSSGGANDGVAYITSHNGATSSVYAYSAPSGTARAQLPSLSHELPGAFNYTAGIAIDQATGDVYVRNQVERFVSKRVHDIIEVFSADGSRMIAHFGDAGSEAESFEEEPEKLHYQSAGIAVDNSGKVYAADADGSGHYRAMCFRPEQAGHYEHYVYCGRAQDVTLNGLSNVLALDDAGDLYRASQETISEYSLANPSSPLCTFNTNGQAYAMTVDPVTQEVFYFLSSKKKVSRLFRCDPAKGRFELAPTAIAISPVTDQIHALAFNPDASWSPERPAGILYGADSQHEIGGGVEAPGIGYIFAPAEVHAPTVETESVSNTRTTSTILQAEINPHGFGTHYVFQYLTEAEYEANDPADRFEGAHEVPVGGGEIDGGSVSQASAPIAGLAPDTSYRFRVIVSSQCNVETGELCLGEGAPTSFATYPLFPPGLPDRRAYELVSPAQKNGGEVIPADPSIASCPTARSGGGCKPITHAVAFPMQSSPDGDALAYEGQPFNPAEGAVDYDSYLARRTASGWQSSALIPAQPPAGVKQLAFDSGLDQSLLSLSGSSLAVQPTSQPGSLTPLVSQARNRAGGLVLGYGGHSADFSRIFFTANDSLTAATPFAPEPPDPGASKNDLYEWREGGQLSVVNVLPGNAQVATSAAFASLSPDTHAISEDGARAFFVDEAGSLYVRENGEVTKAINDAGHFLSASPDGSRVLLTDGCLYSLATESCTDLTEGKGGFQGILGQSKDLSHVYFVDTAVLAANAGAGLDSNGSPQVAETGEVNAYEWSGGGARFIAQLVSGSAGNGPGDSADWAVVPGTRTAEASLDGRFVAFTSTASLRGYDNVGPCGLGTAEEGYPIKPAPCAEAFLYDSATGKLVCASCNPTGEAPLGRSYLRRIEGGTYEYLPQPRYLTDEGRLYFDSVDSLSARDTNDGVEDVYEFAPRGAGAEGTCEREAGCTFLISAGTEAVDSNLVAVDETGKNVFFDTRDKLALKDKDELLDIYDAREGGGIAAETEVARAECQGENCQTPAVAPIDPTPGSSTFEGAGNVKQEGKTKKPSKKKHKKHPKKHKKHSKKKHSKQHKAKKHTRTTKRNHGGAK